MLKLQATPIPSSKDKIICDISTEVPRPFIPDQFRHTVFDSLHSLSDPSIRTTLKLITNCYVWPNMNSDVHKWARSCLSCQQSKVQRHIKAPLATFATPDARFNQVYIDIVGPLPPSQGFTYILTCINHFTHWPEAIPITDLIAELLLVHSFMVGYPALVSHAQSLQTEDVNLNQHC